MGQLGSSSLITAASPSPNSLPDDTAASAITFLHAAVAFFQNYGVSVQCVYSDNGPCYRAHTMRSAIAALSLRHRFAACFPSFLHNDNWHRLPHSLKLDSPTSRFRLHRTTS